MGGDLLLGFTISTQDLQCKKNPLLRLHFEESCSGSALAPCRLRLRPGSVLEKATPAPPWPTKVDA